MVTAGEQQLRELKRLCEQAERLRRDAQKLCRQIQSRLDQSRVLHPDSQPPRAERRRSRR